MKELILSTVPIFMIGVAIALSVSAFYGGVHFAMLTYLSKMKPLNDFIVKNGDAKTLAELNDFLISINVKNCSPTWRDWLRFGLRGRPE